MNNEMLQYFQNGMQAVTLNSEFSLCGLNYARRTYSTSVECSAPLPIHVSALIWYLVAVWE